MSLVVNKLSLSSFVGVKICFPHSAANNSHRRHREDDDDDDEVCRMLLLQLVKAGLALGLFGGTHKFFDDKVLFSFIFHASLFTLHIG